MRPLRPALLFSVSLVASSAQVFANTTSAAAVGGAQIDPALLILLGVVMIGVVIGVRHLIARRHRDSARIGPATIQKRL